MGVSQISEIVMFEGFFLTLGFLKIRMHYIYHQKNIKIHLKETKSQQST